jgi:hypothetical protein
LHNRRRHVTAEKDSGDGRNDPARGLLPLDLVRHPAWRELAVAGACVGLAGCVSFDVGRLPVVSTRQVTAADLERPATLSRVAHGRSCVWVAGVAPILPFPSLSNAVDEALETSHAVALWDAHVQYRIEYVPLFGRGCYLVEGRVP